LNDTPNFLDRKTILAILIVGITVIGWPYYLKTKYPSAPKIAAGTPEVVSPIVSPPVSSAVSAATIGLGAADSGVVSNVEKSVDYQSNNLSFQISSKGMGFKRLKLLKYTNRKGNAVEFSELKPPLSFETRFLGATEPIDFEIVKVNENLFVGHAKVGLLDVTKTVEVDSEKYAFDVKVVVTGQDPKFVGLATFLADEIEAHKPAGFLSGGGGQYDQQEAYIDTDSTHNKHIKFGTDLIDQAWANGRVISIGSPYFTSAFVDHSPVQPEFKLHVDPNNAHLAAAQIQHGVLNKTDSFAIHFTGFAGPKSLSLLKSVDEELVPLIDFGFFAWIARYILEMLKGFYALVGNWGIAIILLTICVRLLVLPFNIMSYRSMKSMQALQPQMKELRERYKDDQQKLNQEMMGLLRTHKVNPLGGCLPVLLQLPIFLALYQVLGHSIELYQAPFGLWIHDLSLKDPIYVLPVLMGITMFMQQKITPNTLDPAQAKIIMFMPLIFSFFMLSLPSGLTLYIWVSALFAVVQQFYFMKSHNPLVEKK
jgi:YidC/Oxa1 family membrane protein insertase